MSRTSKTVYVVSGEALDQETIIAQRHLYEDYVKTDKGINFSKTKLIWDMNKKGNFDFKLSFYANKH